MACAYQRGARQSGELLTAGGELVAAAADAVDYLAVVDPATFLDADPPSPSALAIGAARFGGVRLIDNLAIGPAGAEGEG